MNRKRMCRCCFGDVEGESCGWPKGSIRGTIALISIPMAFLMTCACMIILIVKDQFNIALGMNNGIWGVVGTIVGYYFGTKQGEAAAKLLSKAGHDIIESRNREIEQNNLLTRELRQARGRGINRDDVVLEMVDL